MNEPMATHGAPSWIEHSGTRPEEARAFYEKVLGWTINDMPMKDGSSYPGIVVGDGPVGGICPRPAASGGWLVYITVDDVDARFEQAIHSGANAISKPMDAPGVGRIATIEDPFGASIAFITYAASEQ